MPAEARPAIRVCRLLRVAFVAAGVAGCEFPPGLPPEAVAAYPTDPSSPATGSGAADKSGAPRPDAASCRSLAAAPDATNPSRTATERRELARADVVLATEAGAGPVGTSSPPPPSETTLRRQIYVRCITAGHG